MGSATTPLALERSAGDDRRSVPIAEASPGKVGMWVFLATDLMGFGGLLLAQAFLRVQASSWPDPRTRLDRPLAAALTFVLVASGATMSAGLAASQAGRPVAARRFVLVTAALGLAFVLGQAAEFRALVVDRHVGLATDHAAALFFVITGYHGLHVLAGVGMLMGKGARPPTTPSGSPPSRMDGLEVVSLYWQFVDLVWIVIFTLIYLLPPVSRG